MFIHSFIDSGLLFSSGSLGLEEGVGPLDGEAWIVLAPHHAVRQTELDLGVVELLDSGLRPWPAAVSSTTFMTGWSVPGQGAGHPGHGSTV